MKGKQWNSFSQSASDSAQSPGGRLDVGERAELSAEKKCSTQLEVGDKQKEHEDLQLCRVGNLHIYHDQQKMCMVCSSECLLRDMYTYIARSSLSALPTRLSRICTFTFPTLF